MDPQTEQLNQRRTLTPEQVVDLYKQVDARIEQLRQKPHIKRAADLNAAHLPVESYPYHNYTHINDVFRESLFFALADKALGVPDALNDHQLELLATAAAYHEIEYHHGVKGHEQRGADISEEDLPTIYDFSDRHLIADAIKDTQLITIDNHLAQIQTPTNVLSRYLMDADMSNFGRTDFFDKMRLVFEETRKTTISDVPQRDFEEKTRAFLTHHEWKSDAAKLLREPQRLENVQALQTMLNEPSGLPAK